MEETTPHSNCGLFAGPWANGGAPLAGRRGMAMDRFITRTFRSLPARVSRSERTWEIGDTGVRGFSRRGAGHEARRVWEDCLPCSLADGQGCRRLHRRSLRLRRLSLRPRTAGNSCHQSAFNALCPPPGSDTTLLSSTFLSQGAVRSHTKDARGRTAPPVDRHNLPRIVAIQGWTPGRDLSRSGVGAGDSRFGIAEFPLRQDTFLGSCSTHNPWIAL